MGGISMEDIATAKGETHELPVDIKPAPRIIHFAKSAVPERIDFVEQAASPSGPTRGWVINVTTKHERGREVTNIVKVVLDR
jgi:hypothetical protein